MNTTLKNLSLATALMLGFALTGAAHAASHAAPSNTAGQGKVMHLGTITVTRADAEGRKSSRYGSTMVLPAIHVTGADRSDRYGSTMVLRSIRVAPTDTEEARYARNMGKGQAKRLTLSAVLSVIRTLVFG